MIKINLFSLLFFLFFCSNLFTAQSEKPIVIKCCPNNTVYFDDDCIPYKNGLLNYSSLIIYDKKINPTHNKAVETFQMIYNGSFITQPQVVNIDMTFGLSKLTQYITEVSFIFLN